MMPKVTTDIEVLKSLKCQFVAVWSYGNEWWSQEFRYRGKQLEVFNDLDERFKPTLEEDWVCFEAKALGEDRAFYLYGEADEKS